MQLTALQELIKEFEQLIIVSSNPIITVQISLTINSLNSKLEKERQQLVDAYKAGEVNIDFPALHGYGKKSNANKYYTENYEPTT